MKSRLTQFFMVLGLCAMASGTFVLSETCGADALCGAWCTITAPVVECTSGEDYALCKGYDENGNLIATDFDWCRPVIPGPGC